MKHKYRLFGHGGERRVYHQPQADPFVFYRKYWFILVYVDDCAKVSHKQETITQLFESLKNVPENYVLTNEGDISNYLGINTKINSDGKFELTQSHLM